MEREVGYEEIGGTWRDRWDMEDIMSIIFSISFQNK